jgi:hypothetical protein
VTLVSCRALHVWIDYVGDATHVVCPSTALLLLPKCVKNIDMLHLMQS